MRRVLIVGAGQGSLRLAHGLLAQGYDVTVINGQSSMEIRSSRPAITQFTLPGVVEDEQAAGLDLWTSLAPRLHGARMFLYPPGGDPRAPAVVAAPFGRGPAVSIDRRVKISDWLESFEDRGGKVVIHGITVSDLDYFSRMYDLIVLAVGHGELGALFDQAPPLGRGRARAVAQVYLDDVWPVSAVQVPGQGAVPPGLARAEAFETFADVASTPDVRAILAPILTREGPVHVLQLVAPAGGVLDRWPDRPTPQEILRHSLRLLAEHAPHLHHRVRDAVLVEDTTGHANRSASVYSYAPHVRNPVAALPDGGTVLGMGDVVVTTDDPVAAQGWGASNAAALTYLHRILERADDPFDPQWMADTFRMFWEGQRTEGAGAGVGAAALGLSDVLDVLWDPAAPAHLRQVLAAATDHPQVARRFVDVLDEPRDVAWLADPQEAAAYLSTLS